MRGLKLEMNFSIDGKTHIVRISICLDTIRRLAEEINSPLNRQGTQKRFFVHEPTIEQLIINYVETGGLQQFVEHMGLGWHIGHPTASLVS